MEQMRETSAMPLTQLDLKGNRVLTPEDRNALAASIDELRELSPEIMQRKIPEAVFQNAFIYEQVKNAVPSGSSIILIGGYEDPIGPALSARGYSVEITDPNVDGRDALAVWLDARTTETRYDAIVCCSVIEHVPNDGLFVRLLYQLLKPGGSAFLTTDFSEGWTEELPAPDLRLYTVASLNALISHLPEDSIVDRPSWLAVPEYFDFDGVRYCFASITFFRPQNSPDLEIASEELFDALSQGASEMGRTIATYRREIDGLYKTVAIQQTIIEDQQARLERVTNDVKKKRFW